MEERYIAKLMTKNELMVGSNFLYNSKTKINIPRIHELIETLNIPFIRDEIVIAIKNVEDTLSYWLTVADYKQKVKSMIVNVIVSEHFGRADTSIEIAELHDSSTIVVIHKDGEAIIYPSIYDMCMHQINGGGNIDRFYCDEAQLDFVYSNFKDYCDIKNNFDVETTKRKENGENR